ncbi:MAG: efflux RND transporter permease subunit [Arenicellales bacterium]
MATQGKSLSDLAIRRPVTTIVASLLIVTAGFAALNSIPIRELPDVDSSVVTVTTRYQGASPQVIDTDITEVIESAVSGVAGIESISSQSRRGRSQTVIEFRPGRNIDEAANDIRDAVGRARGRLPDDIDDPVVVKSDSDADPVMRIAVSSNRHTPEQITDYVERYIVDRLSTLDGVASVDIRGERRYAIRIWLDRRAMAARNLTVSDVQSAIGRSNLELPAGDLKSTQRMLEIRLDGRLSTPEDFQNIVLREVDGYPVRLSDIATIEKGVENDDLVVRANGQSAVGMQVLRQSQANTMDISNRVRAEIKLISETLPEGMEVIIGSDDALFISASIREVLIALGISLLLVVGVIILFLRSFKTALVPIVTIPVALIGCIAVIYALGFSINVITLLALLLAIGLVVDDAIVVLENIKRRVENGEPAREAALRGTRQVTFAVLATSVTLIAAFIPISLLEGQVGKLFSEFGLIMAAAVVISTFVALSLCPMLASRILRGLEARATYSSDSDDSDADVRFSQTGLSQLYNAGLLRAIQSPVLVIGIALAFSLGAVGLYTTLPRDLVPKEDRGVAFIPMSAPQGSTQSYTDAQTRIVEKQLKPFQDDGSIQTVYTIIGWGNRPYRGFVVMRLAHWDEREQTQAQIVNKIRPITQRLIGVRAGVASPSGLGLRGNSTPLRIIVGGPDFSEVKQAAADLLAHAEANENLINPQMDYEENQPQIDLKLDRRRADDLGVSVEEIAFTLQSMFASKQVSTYVDRGREYPVIVQAKAQDRKDLDSLANIFVRSVDADTGTRKLVPLSVFVSAKETAAAAELRRFDRLPSITISAGIAPEYTLGDALNYMEEGAAETLPTSVKLSYSGQSKVFKSTSGGAMMSFAFALLIVFLVLAAQFESFVHPFVIILSVPLAIAGAIYSLTLMDLSLNVYSQIGIILLVGLMAKNGILIVEFANQLRESGYAIREAVLRAAVLRLRPIVMTVLSTVLGALPLVLASGAGAESRIAIGWVIVGGLGLALFLTLFLTPVLYDLMARFARFDNEALDHQKKSSKAEQSGEVSA